MRTPLNVQVDPRVDHQATTRHTHTHTHTQVNTTQKRHVHNNRNTPPEIVELYSSSQSPLRHYYAQLQKSTKWNGCCPWLSCSTKLTIPNVGMRTPLAPITAASANTMSDVRPNLDCEGGTVIRGDTEGTRRAPHTMGSGQEVVWAIYICIVAHLSVLLTY